MWYEKNDRESSLLWSRAETDDQMARSGKYQRPGFLPSTLRRDLTSTRIRTNEFEVVGPGVAKDQGNAVRGWSSKGPRDVDGTKPSRVSGGGAGRETGVVSAIIQTSTIKSITFDDQKWSLSTPRVFASLLSYRRTVFGGRGGYLGTGRSIGPKTDESGPRHGRERRLPSSETRRG